MKILTLSMQGCARILGWDAMVASALVLRGHEVSMMGCGLSLSACDCSDLTVMPKFGGSCQDNRPVQVSRNIGYNLPVLRRYLQPNDYLDSAHWAMMKGRTLKKALTVEYKGLPIGHMAHQSWRNFWRSIKPRELGSEPSILSFLASTKLLVDVWERAIEDLQPDLVFTLNGLYPRQRIPCELVKRRGGRFVTYDVMGQSFHLHQNQGAPYLHQDEAWDKVIPTEEELHNAELALQSEREHPGASFGEDYLKGQTTVEDWDWIKKEYGIDDRPFVAWFSNVAYDSGVVGYDGGYPDLPDVIVDTIEMFRGDSKHQLIIQMHPNERNDPEMTLKGETLTSFLAYTYPNGLPENVKVIPAESNASPFTIAEHALAACTWTSSLTWQLAYNQIPTIVAGWAACSNHVGYACKTVGDYHLRICEALAGNLKAKPEWKEAVLSYKAIVEGRCWIDMSHLIGAGGVNEFIPQWNGGWATLKPGMDVKLDSVIDCIENGEPFYWPR
jgi:hypothetical protein